MIYISLANDNFQDKVMVFEGGGANYGSAS